MEHGFKINDKTIDFDGNIGEVWKISSKGIHVRYKKRNYKYDYFLFAVFHFNPKHHSQTSIEKLKHHDH